ncbi:hypothetical protein CTAYLR_000460 [Chrysophaeum taylorii]|uniref:Sulfatase N-terminal domain-containing protein n=1 Tax=Chrysophaeum taylorii TaxID=2483200 RepID=A0AAD7XLX7_9STRA|nr:hypothetical protein CTAYLR_000460 [Chrysophaeum taylorii]
MWWRSESPQAEILHVVVDDVGLNDLWESEDLPWEIVTPTIGGLATRGVRLENYYGQSYCTPARVAMLTGMWTHRVGFAVPPTFQYGNVEVVVDSNYSIPVSGEYQLLPQHLKTLGYATHGIGKWNVGHCNSAYLPWNRGFDTFLGYFGDGIYYRSHLADQQTSIVLGDQNVTIVDFVEYESAENFRWDNGIRAYNGTHTTIAFSRAARKILSASTDLARYVWLAYHGMHDNYEPTSGLSYNETLWAELEATFGYTPRRKAFGVGLQAIDSEIRSLVDVLEAGARDYVVVFHSDNGAAPCAQHVVGNNMPARGSKFSDFEGGLRVPAFAYSNLLKRRGAVYSSLMHHVDWMATLVSIAGGNPTELLGFGYDSLDHWDNIRQGLNKTVRDAAYFSITETTFSLRRGNWKLIHGYENSSWYPVSTEVNQQQDCYFGSRPMNFLFDLANDPFERHNLYHDEAHRRVKEGLIALGKGKYANESVSFSKGRLFTDADNYDASSPIARAWLNSAPGSKYKVVTPWQCDTITL